MNPNYPASQNGPAHPEKNGSNHIGQTGFSNSHDSGQQKNKDEVSIGELFTILWANKFLILFIMILAGGLAYLYADHQTPIFESEASIIVTDDRSSSGGAGSIGRVIESSYGIGVGSRIGNELAVLRSNQFASRVAEHIMQNPVKGDNEGVDIDSLKEAGLTGGKFWPVMWKSYPENDSLVTQRQLANRIQNRLEVSREASDSEIVQLFYRSPSAEETTHVLNVVLEIYDEYSTEQSRQQVRSAQGFLDQEKNRVKAELESTEEQLREFMNREGIVSLDRQAEELISRLSEMESELQRATVEKAAIDSALNNYRGQLESMRPGLADRYAEGIAPRLTRYQYQLAELETERMMLLNRNPDLRNQGEGEQNSRLQQLNRQIDELKQEIRGLAGQVLDGDDSFLGFLSSADGDVGGEINDLKREVLRLQVESQQYDAQIEVLEERLEREEAFFGRIPDHMTELARLQRNVDVNERLYNTISEQSAELTVLEHSQSGKGRVIDHATVPGGPVEPNVLMILATGLFAGGIIAIGLVLLKERNRTQITGVGMLMHNGYSVVGVIPDFSKHNKEKFSNKDFLQVGTYKISTNLITMHDKLSPFSETFRRLQSNIIYAHPDHQIQTIVVTSAMQGEGKSTVAANLAVVFAEAQDRVLLLDCDFRKPMVKKMFGLYPSPGLVEMLFEDMSIDDVTLSTAVDGLDVITSGQQVPNPAAVTRSKRFSAKLAELKKNYDTIIIDTPPIGITSEAAPLLHIADGGLLVTRFNQSQEYELRQAMNQMRSFNATNLGLVLNAYEHNKSTDYHYGSMKYYRKANHELEKYYQKEIT